jgi:uncharacterized iron-regulated membrane protein
MDRGGLGSFTIFTIVVVTGGLMLVHEQFIAPIHEDIVAVNEVGPRHVFPASGRTS